MAKSEPRTCTCARCTGIGRPDPIWGFDLDAVPQVPCIACAKPIGDAPYKLNTTYARFGDMLFRHIECPA